MVRCEPSSTVHCSEDWEWVGTAEVDVGLVDVVKHGLLYPQTTRQRMDQLGAESCGFDSNQDLHGEPPTFAGNWCFLCNMVLALSHSWVRLTSGSELVIVLIS